MSVHVRLCQSVLVSVPWRLSFCKATTQNRGAQSPRVTSVISVSKAITIQTLGLLGSLERHGRRARGTRCVGGSRHRHTDRSRRMLRHPSCYTSLRGATGDDTRYVSTHVGDVGNPLRAKRQHGTLRWVLGGSRWLLGGAPRSRSTREDTIFQHPTEKIASVRRIRSVTHIHETEVVREDLKLSNWLWIDRSSLPSLYDFETATEQEPRKTVPRHAPRPEVPKNNLKKHTDFQIRHPRPQDTAGIQNALCPDYIVSVFSSYPVVASSNSHECQLTVHRVASSINRTNLRGTAKVGSLILKSAWARKNKHSGK